MEVILIINCVLLIAIVLLQSNKAEGASAIISGGNESLFANRKERGSELFITRMTMFLATTFFLTCLFLGF